MCDKMAISAYILKIVKKDPTLDQSRGRKTDGRTRRSQRRGEEGGDSGHRGPAFQAPHQSESTSRIWMLDFIGSYLTGLER